MGNRKEPQIMEMSVAHNRKTYTGTYHIDKDRVTVNCDYGSKSSRASGDPENNKAIARILLRELIDSGNQPDTTV